MPVAKLSENRVKSLLCSSLVCNLFIYLFYAFSIFLQEDFYLLSWKSQHLRHTYSFLVYVYPPISAPKALIQKWYVYLEVTLLH